MVRVDGHLGVIQKNAQSRTALAHVGQRLRQRMAWQQTQLFELLVHPVEEFVYPRLAVRYSLQPLGLALELVLSNVILDLVQRRDLRERLAGGLGLRVLGLEDAAPGVGPALGVGDADLLGIGHIGPIPVGQQHRARCELGAQGPLHMLVPARFEVRETHLVLVAVDGPEVGRLLLPVAGLPGLDADLVHRDDVAAADGLELGVEDGFEQPRALLHPLRQPLPADIEPRIEQPLVLAIQRQVNGAGESHPRALPEPDVNLSAHPAPIAQSP
jgi:hypothetical protein